ncbi:sulfurtransferase TusA family protein [Thiomicrorhabdus cannonii]|uniref:sulfurtransferase TusA family protein n=1 Tax=Thiomicrorhabdus cannonii TaxID=2748011 RepID=UPI0015BEA4C4|nr:sulfurtransferase TusA family protein [Thiomicrorhabdus cannonii]
MECLDLTGLACPMPLIKLKKYLAETAGQSRPFLVSVSDRGALKDIPAFCLQKGLACQLVSDNVPIQFQIHG